MSNIGSLDVSFNVDLTQMQLGFARARSTIQQMELRVREFNSTLNSTASGGMNNMTSGFSGMSGAGGSALSMLGGFVGAGLILKGFETVVNLAKAGLDLLKDSIVNLVKTGIEYNATMEDNQAAFEVMLGSATKAKNLMEQIRVMAAKTPFETEDLTSASKTLMGFGLAQEKVLPTMKMLGDIALGNKDRFKGLALVYAQVQSQGKLMGQDLLQMINNGFNPLQAISKKTGKSMSELKDEMSKGKISFKMVEDAMMSATSKGGMFYGSMDKASQTFNGQISTMKDNFSNFAGIVTKPIFDMLSKKAFPIISKLGGQVSEMFQSKGVIGGLDALIGKLVPGFNGFKTLVAGVKTAWTEFMAGLSGNESGDLTFFQQMFQNLGTTVRDIFNKVKNINWSEVFAKIQSYIKPFMDNWANIKTSLLLFFASTKTAITAWWNVVKLVFNWVVTVGIPLFSKAFATALPIIILAFAGIMQVIRLFYTSFKVVLDTIIPIVTAFWTGLIGAFKSATAIIMGVVNLFINLFKGNWTGAWESVKTIVVAGWNFIKSLYKAAGGMLVGIIQGVVNLITNLFGLSKVNVSNIVSSLWSTVSSWFYRIGSSVVSAVSSLPGKVGSIFGSIKNSIWGAISGLASSAYTWGSNIIQGLINGISSMIGAVKSKVSDIAGTIKSFFPNSPAKTGPLTTIPTWGPNIIDMVSEGMQKRVPKLIDITDNISKSINDSMKVDFVAGNINSVSKFTNTQNTAVKLYLDGKQVAYTTAPHMINYMSKQGV